MNGSELVSETRSANERVSDDFGGKSGVLFSEIHNPGCVTGTISEIHNPGCVTGTISQFSLGLVGYPGQSATVEFTLG
jgi:hypothetical protein